MSEFTIKDKVAIAGVGETAYYKRGAAPVSEFRLALEAIRARRRRRRNPGHRDRRNRVLQQRSK